MPDLPLAYYGDDFTGSVDVMLQVARHGWRSRLFVGLPGEAELRRAAAENEAVGIAGIARSLPTDRIEDEVRPALAALAALGPAVLQYKACSTADSSPTIGSLGRVIEVAHDVVGAAPVPVLFAQPDFGRYTAFGHHFAADDGVVHRLDRQPTMSSHPSTPMTESDLARHLSAQTALPVSAIPFTAYGDDLAERILAADAAAVVLDALDDTHLRAVGAAVHRLPSPAFALGSGGLSWALAATAPENRDALHHAASPSGPVLAVSGSRSRRTRRQIDVAAAAGWLVEPLDGDHPDAQRSRVAEALAAGRSVALSSDDAALGEGAVLAGGGSVLERIAELAAGVVAHAAAAVGTRRVVVCGGDTSSRVTRLLGVASLRLAGNPWGNVVLLEASSPDPSIDGIELLLKGGQVGDDDLLERVRALGRV